MQNNNIAYVSAEEVAKKLGISVRRIQQLCSSGKVDGAIIEGKSWLLPEKSVDTIPVRKKKAKVDRKPLPIGISDFKRAVSEYYYVDKTLLIKEFLDTKPQVILFTRPRRFGKTLNMDMLRVFFEKTDEDTSVYFSDKAIWKCGDKYRDEQGKYPVIFISLKDVKFDTWEQTFEMIKRLVRSDNVKPILIIDEYDVPVQQGHSCGFYNEVISFLRNFFSGAIKDNSNISYAFLTGILKIAKESIFSGMNNLKTDSILDDRYSEYFGFTKDEVKTMLEVYGAGNKFNEACEWYDGYKFGSSEIFNPWSIINYVDDNCAAPKAYWVSTGSNDIIGDIISKATPEIMDNLNKLLRRESVNTFIDIDVIYPEIEKNPSSIYSFLLVAGYLNIVEKKQDGDSVYCKVAIPNKEISYVYEKEVLGRLENIVPQSSAIAIQTAIFERDGEKLQAELRKLLINTISYNDTANESFYHGLTVGLCAAMNNYYYVYSNREAGEGRFDICLYPQADKLPGVIIELKACKGASAETLEKLANKAIKQIDDNQYDVDLRQHGVKNVFKLGIAFCGKEVKVACGE